MDDYISRQVAIEATKHAWAKGLEPTQYIEQIPAADVRPVVRGRWGDDDCCTNCGEEADYNWESGVHYYSNFCPNCGADMREEQNEADLV